MSFGQDVSADERAVWQGIVCDPQTSGGLLFAMNEHAAKHYLKLHPEASIIGKAHEGAAGHLHLV
jgi:selenophosphate synthase